MARKTMVKEVTHTTLKVARMEVENGSPKAVSLPDVTLIGNVNLEKAQRYALKELGKNVTVFEVIPETIKYEMSVEEFIKHAAIKEEQTEAELEN
jgi:hypothetical protein